MNSSSDVLEDDIKNFKVLIVGDPDVATSFFSKNETNEVQLGTITTLKAREINIQDMRFELWYCHETKDIEERDKTFEDAEGVIALFNKGDADSFGYIPSCISDVVKYAGKMLPTFVLGLSKPNYLEQISREDVLDYLYSLGNVSACMIPYVELESPSFQSVEEVLMDLVKIIECNRIENCFTKPAILRGQCGLKQFEVKTE